MRTSPVIGGSLRIVTPVRLRSQQALSTALAISLERTKLEGNRRSETAKRLIVAVARSVGDAAESDETLVDEGTVVEGHADWVQCALLDLRGLHGAAAGQRGCREGEGEEGGSELHGESDERWWCAEEERGNRGGDGRDEGRKATKALAYICSRVDWRSRTCWMSGTQLAEI